MREVETRASAPVEVREAEGGGVRVEGYAAVFGEEANIAGMFLERIEPGAFRAAVARDDVVLLVNHEGLPLARTRSGTLELREDARGLWVGSTLDPEDPDVRALVPKLRRGDLSKMSFAFRALRQEWDESRQPPLRILREVELLDVSVVTTPAYGNTEVALRSLQCARKETARAAYQARRRRMKRNLAASAREG